MAKWLSAACPAAVALALAVCLSTAAQVEPALRFTPSDVYRLAAAHVSLVEKRGKGNGKYALFISQHAIPLERRDRTARAVALGVNSLAARIDQPVAPEVVADSQGALLYFDLEALGIPREKLDRLGRLGSGPAPFPEPFFHFTKVVDRPRAVEESYTARVAYTERVQEKTLSGYGVVEPDGRGGYRPKMRTVTRYRTVTRKRTVAQAGRVFETAVGGYLDRAAVIGLTVLTQTDFPVFEARWFLFNSLVEPRYHEILGFEDLNSFERLAHVDEELADRFGSLARGAVLLSEVGERNRALKRTPTLAKFGRAAFYKSLDFKSSVGAQDVLSDLLVERADAFEVLLNLPSGLIAAGVFDGKGKRLDKADPDVAQDRRTPFRDHQVWAAYKCLACHLAEKGWIPVEDEVSLGFGKRQTKLFADAFAKDGERGRRIRQQYLSVDINELIEQDQAFTESWVKAATGGMGSAEANKVLMELIYEWTDAPRSLDDLVMYTGATRGEILRAVEGTPGLANQFVGIRVGRKQRPDQIEANLAQLLTVLYARD